MSDDSLTMTMPDLDDGPDDLDDAPDGDPVVELDADETEEAAAAEPWSTASVDAMIADAMDLADREGPDADRARALGEAESALAVRKAEAATRTGVPVGDIATLTLDLVKLGRDGIFGDVDTTATRMMLTIDLREMGSWRPAGGDGDTLAVRNPQISLLPKKWLERLRWPLADARKALNEHSFRFHATDCVLGPTFRYIPWTDYQAFRLAFDAACKKLDAVKEEMVAPGVYEKACADVVKDAEAIALHSARSLEANGVDVADDFVPTFVAKVQGRIPSRGQITNGLRIVFKPGVLATTGEIEAQVALANQAKPAEGMVRLEMRQFVENALKEQLAAQVGPIAEMANAIKGQVYQTLQALRDSIKVDGYLPNNDLKKVSGIYAKLEGFRRFMDGETPDVKFDDLMDDLQVYAGMSNATRSDKITAKLETVILELQQVCAEALPEDTGVGVLAIDED